MSTTTIRIEDDLKARMTAIDSVLLLAVRAQRGAGNKHEIGT